MSHMSFSSSNRTFMVAVTADLINKGHDFEFEGCGIECVLTVSNVDAMTIVRRMAGSWGLPVKEQILDNPTRK